jgi:hygromycin-B 7''-O-kinase
MADARLLAAIAGQHGLGADAVRPIPAGVANEVYLLGDDLVLRIPRSAAFAADLRKETVVIPAARQAGVRTPKVVTFHDRDTPWLVIERVPGVDLAQLELPRDQVDEVYRQAGHDLAKLHRTAADATPDIPRHQEPASPQALVAGLLADGYLDVDAARWLDDWFARLAAQMPATPPPLVLIHGDLAPQNLMVDPATGQYAGVVDWGDAEWADPAVDFAKTPPIHLPALLDGYRSESGESAASLHARALRYHLAWALARLRDPTPKPGQRHWSAPPASRLLALLRLHVPPA